MSEPKIRVGSFSNWLLFRCISFVMLIGGLVFVVSNLHPFRLEFFCMGMLWAIIGVMGSHDLIYGVADQEGIHYRQYLTLRLLRWEDISTISWTNANIVHFHVKGSGRSRPILSAQSQQSKSWAQLYSEEPELVRWLTLAKPPAADGIEIRDPAASLPAFLRWDPIVARRIFQFLLILIAVILIFSVVYARR
jgi:hypothetical protein